MSALSDLPRHLREGLAAFACRRRRPRLLGPLDHEWRQGLPAAHGDDVVAPLWFEVALDYEVRAERVLGRDAQSRPCYCCYQCTLTDLVCEDGELFFEGLAYAEQVRAWRLADSRWLVCRSVTTPDRPELPRIEYRIQEAMPR